jgi:prepilin-type processing-associated H-X9-DG protein
MDLLCTTLVRRGNLIVAGASWVVERRKGMAPVPRPELDKAAARAKPAAIQIYLIPTVDSRRVLEAMLPTMTDQKLQIPTNALVNGLQWAVHSIDLPPRGSVDVYVESGNADSARALQAVIAQAWQAVGQFSPIKAAYPDLGEALARLTPQVKGDSLQVALDTRQFTSLASEVLTPGFFELRESILRTTCGETLSGMGKAMLIYANDYEDEWPPSLETLVDKAEYPRSGLICPTMRHEPDYESYVYRGVDTGGTSVEPMIIMVHDRAGNHPGGRNVLFVDSHVEWVTEERFQQLIAEDNKMRRKRGLPEKPAQ